MVSKTSSNSLRLVFEYMLQNLSVNDLRAFTSLYEAYFTESLTSSDNRAKLVRNRILYSFDMSLHLREEL